MMSQKFTAAILIAVSLGIPNISRADLSEADYQAALKVAEKKVARRQSLNSQSANALSSSLIRTLFGRHYRVGDEWDVASWSFDNTMARMTSDPQHMEIKGGRGGIFHYEIVSVKNGLKPEVVVQVTQREELGLKKVDARVQSLLLAMNDQMLQSEKTYLMADRSGTVKEIKVSPDGIRSGITRLELFALDVPELVTAESTPAIQIPELPQGLRPVAGQSNYKPDLSQSLWFEQDDFFGRPIQALWQRGNPWPSYLKTSTGVSILIRKGST